MDSKTRIVDFLVLGSGISGLSFALKAAKMGKVLVVTKTRAEIGCTALAQGGIAAVLPTGDRDDSFELHVEDTLRTGAGICKRTVVEKVVQYAPKVVEQLTALGVEFTKREEPGEPHEGPDGFAPGLTREGGHSRSRVVHVADFTGRAIEQALLAVARAEPNIEIWEYHMAVDLLTQHQIEGYVMRPWDSIRCYGAYILDIQTEVVHTVIARKTILATGGAGKIYLHTTNPNVSSGDGIALAFRAGASIGNLEFMQFHPTVLYDVRNDDEPSFLISEAVRGEGAILLNSDGKRFMRDYHDMAELAPRDIVARAIDTELKQSGERFVYLDIRDKSESFLRKRFPTIYRTCAEQGIDIAHDLIPVVPAAHYLCGGIVVDEWGNTDIENLYACGECACTGMHGANRLASNSLLEAFAFADFCFADICRCGFDSEILPKIPSWDDSGAFDRKEWVILRHNYQMLRAIMWDYMGIVRSISRLERALDRVRLMWSEIDEFYRKNPVRLKILELRNMAYIAESMIRCALLRKESRGLHYVSDFPNTENSFLHDTILKHSGIYKETHI